MVVAHGIVIVSLCFGSFGLLIALPLYHLEKRKSQDKDSQIMI